MTFRNRLIIPHITTILQTVQHRNDPRWMKHLIWKAWPRTCRLTPYISFHHGGFLLLSKQQQQYRNIYTLRDLNQVQPPWGASLCRSCRHEYKRPRGKEFSTKITHGKLEPSMRRFPEGRDVEAQGFWCDLGKKWPKGFLKVHSHVAWYDARFSARLVFETVDSKFRNVKVSWKTATNG